MGCSGSKEIEKKEAPIEVTKTPPPGARTAAAEVAPPAESLPQSPLSKPSQKPPKAVATEEVKVAVDDAMAVGAAVAAAPVASGIAIAREETAAIAADNAAIASEVVAEAIADALVATSVATGAMKPRVSIGLVPTSRASLQVSLRLQHGGGGAAGTTDLGAAAAEEEGPHPLKHLSTWLGNLLSPRSGGPDPAVPPPLSPEGRAKASAAFRKMDNNGDGSLSRAEVILAVKKDAEVRELLGLGDHAQIRQEDGSRDAFEVVFQSLDANSDKVIDEAEFVKFFGPAVDETAAAAAELTTTAELEQAKLLK